MTPEEQRALAIECGADERIITGYGMTYEFNATELATYTAAIEAKRDADIAIRYEYVEELRARERGLTRKLAEQQAVFDRMAKTIGGNGIYAAEKVELDALLAKERERCLAKCEIVRNIYIDQDRPARDTALLCVATCDCESAIRSLK